MNDYELIACKLATRLKGVQVVYGDSGSIRVTKGRYERLFDLPRLNPEPAWKSVFNEEWTDAFTSHLERVIQDNIRYEEEKP